MERLARIIHDDSSRDQHAEARGLAPPSAAGPQQTGTGTRKKGASPQQYVEGPRGKPAGCRLVGAAIAAEALMSNAGQGNSKQLGRSYPREPSKQEPGLSRYGVFLHRMTSNKSDHLITEILG